MAASRVLSAWLPVVAWAALIFTRKLAHAAEYAVLAVLLWRALESGWAAFWLAVAYAITDEIHQAFVPGRHMSPLDVAVDAAGAAVGLLFVLRVRR